MGPTPARTRRTVRGHGEDAEGARHEEERRAVEVRPPDVAVRLRGGGVVRQRRHGADVEEQGAGELRRGREPVTVVRQPAPEPHRRRPGAGRPSSTPVVSGLCAWRSWANEAEVKKTEPDDVRHPVHRPSHGADVGGDRAEDEARGPEDEQPGDHGVQAHGPHRHDGSPRRVAATTIRRVRPEQITPSGEPPGVARGPPERARAPPAPARAPSQPAPGAWPSRRRPRPPPRRPPG